MFQQIEWSIFVHIMTGWHIDRWPCFTSGIIPSLEGVLKICNFYQIPLWTTHLMEMMMALGSSFWEDQNRPKDHLVWTRKSWFLILCTHSWIFDQGDFTLMHTWTGQPQYQMNIVGHPLQAYKYKWPRNSFRHYHIKHLLLFYLIWFDTSVKEKVVQGSEVTYLKFAQN